MVSKSPCHDLLRVDFVVLFWFLTLKLSWVWIRSECRINLFKKIRNGQNTVFINLFQEKETELGQVEQRVILRIRRFPVRISLMRHAGLRDSISYKTSNDPWIESDMRSD